MLPAIELAPLAVISFTVLTCNLTFYSNISKFSNLIRQHSLKSVGEGTSIFQSTLELNQCMKLFASVFFMNDVYACI